MMVLGVGDEGMWLMKTSEWLGLVLDESEEIWKRLNLRHLVEGS